MATENATAPPPEAASLSTVNTQLLAHGFARRPLNLSALADRDQADVTATLYELLGSSISNLSTLDALAARHRTLSYEHERLSKSLTVTKLSEGRLHAEVGLWKARVADLEKRLGREEDKGRGLREEVARGRRAVETVRVAANHEAKKAQAKLDKALAQLTRAEPARPAHGLVLLNPIIGNKPAPVAAPLLEQSLKELAEIRHGLQEETDAFRHIIVSTANEMRDALALAEGQDPPARLSHFQFFSPSLPASTSTRTPGLGAGTLRAAPSTSHPSLADAHLRALLSDVHARLTSNAPPPPSALALASDAGEDDEARAARERAERERSRALEDLVSRVKDLEVELRCGEAREAEAKKALEELARSQVHPSPTIPLDDTIDLRAEVARQKRALDEDKRKLTESTIRLVAERERLEAFLDERRAADTERLRVYLPASPSSPSFAPSSASAASTPPSDAATDGSDPSPPPASPARHHHAAHPHHARDGPHGPSPLSPHRRTPKRRPKTPLSRLVLEKAARERSRAAAGSAPTPLVGGSSTAGARTGPALTDGARRANAPAPVAGPAGLAAPAKADADTPAPTPGALGASARAHKTLGASAARRVDVGAAHGVGPRGAAKSRAWR